MNLYGTPSLQGNTQPLQGGVNPLQTGNPQIATNPYTPAPAPTIASPRPVVKPTVTRAPAPAPVTHAPVQPQQLNPIFDAHIGTRASATNPGVLEYYNKQTGQGFSDPNSLFSYASTLGAGSINSFDQLHAPIQSYNNVPSISTITPNPNARLAQTAGQAGLTPDEYQKIVQGQNALTPDEIAQIRGGLGIDQLEQQVFQPPAQNTVDLYNKAYHAAGLSDLKAQIQSTIDQVNKLNSAFTDKAGTINENPFLSEASRIGRQRILTDQRDAQVGNLLTGLKNYQDLYSAGLNEVNGLVQRHTADFSQSQSLNAQKLQYLLSKAEQQGAAKLSQKNQAAYQYLPDYLNAKAGAAAPTTVSAGNGATYYWDKNSKTFVQLAGQNGNFDVNPLTGELYSKNTGQGASGGYGAGLSFNTNSKDMRTDRNNNPTAFTTDIAKQAGLIEGVDYVRGDKFPGSSNLYTAKLLGDPIATTIKAIDKIGFKTASGQPRWTYLDQIPDAKNWANLTYDQKARVIAQMYSHEGGNGSLVSGGTSGSLIDSLVQQVRSNPQVFGTLSPAQQAAVTARMAQQGIPIPSQTGNPTDVQNQAATYATRIQQSGSVLDNLANNIATYNPVGFAAQMKLPSYLQSSQIQQYQQAARNLINAILRRESGAAISQSEFDNAYAQYLPMPGNDAKTIAQKKQNRDTILQGLVKSSGPASGGLQMPAGYSGSTPANLSDLNFKF